MAADTSWSEAEAWAWERICSGAVADFASYKNGGSASPGDYEKWPKQERRLRAAFLRTILSDSAYVNAITYQGVRIWSAYFDEPIILSQLRFDKPLELREVVFEQPLYMENYRSESVVSLQGSWFRYLPPPETLLPDPRELPSVVPLSMSGAHIGANLALDGVTASDANLQDVEVKRHVNLSSSTFDGVVDLSGAHIDGFLLFQHSLVGNAIMLRQSNLGSDAIFSDTRVIAGYGDHLPGALILDGAHISGSITVGSATDQLAMPTDARLANPSDNAPPPADTAAPPQTGPAPNQQGGRFPGRYAFMAGTVSMNGATINGEVGIRKAEIPLFLNLQDAHIGDDLWITSSHVGNDDLTGAVVKGFLLLQDSVFDVRLFLDSAEIGRHLVMSRGTDIKGWLQMGGVKLGGSFFGEGAHIGGSPAGEPTMGEPPTPVFQSNSPVSVQSAGCPA
ncbi:MAG: hypothetical protein R3D05_05440 [Dongiaceae bacterium]